MGNKKTKYRYKLNINSINWDVEATSAAESLEKILEDITDNLTVSWENNMPQSERYVDNFSDIDDVHRQFGISDFHVKDHEIIVAAYEQESYEGYAYVLFSRDNKLFENVASHCSCNGLEDQWSPEETSLEALDLRIREGRPSTFAGGYDTVAEYVKSRKN